MKVMRKEEFYLPYGIIHHIMCCLDPKQAAQVAVLSKRWLFVWQTNPKLEFDDKYFHKDDEHWFGVCKRPSCIYCKVSKQKFRDYVRSTIARYQEEENYMNIQELSLDHAAFTHHDNHDDSASFLDQQLQIALQKGVKVIRLSVNSHKYSVPSSVLEAKSLTGLSLSGCKFQINGNILFSNIKSLHLKEVYIDDDDEEMFSSFISGCRLIDDLLIHKCKGLNIIKLINLRKLKKIDVCFFGKINTLSSSTTKIKIDIDDVPCLESLKLEGPDDDDDDRMVLNFPELHSSSKMLRYLQLTKTYIKDSVLDNLMSNVPCIEVLKLYSCNGFKRFNLASSSLKHICMYSPPKQLMEVDLDAPNMTKFEYGGITFWRLQKQILKATFSTKCVSVISTSLHWYSTDHASWFLKFNEFISNLSPSKVSLDLSCRMWISDDMHMGDIPTPTSAANAAEVEELNIHIASMPDTSSSCVYSRLLDGLFWACHPKALVLLPGDGDFIKFLCTQFSKKMNLSDYHWNCYTFWHNDLRRVELKMYDKTGKQQHYHLRDLRMLHTVLRTTSKVLFKLVWKAN